jgi:hypothetical protein
MSRKFPIHPAHPERICWGCDRYCPSDALMCGNGTVATLHPSELFGEDWMSWGLDADKARAEAAASASPSIDAPPAGP